MIILPANSLSSAYEVANSCRFNAGDSPKLEKGMSDGNRDRWTFSCWVKRCALPATNLQTVFAAEVDGTNGTWIGFDSAEKLRVANLVSGSWQGIYITNRVFRDVSAWYNIVVVWDSGNATAGDRIRVYVNGTEETSFGTETNPSSGQDSWANQTASTAYFRHGYNAGYSQYTDMYLAEVVFIDGTVYAASDFGEFDEDSPTIWKPKDVSGLTFGTNGYYLDFEDSSNLGNDANGGTDLTETNIAAADQATDTPTNNFSVMNPLDNYWQGSTFSQGNCVVTTTNAATTFNTSTFGMTKGKWYWEMMITDVGSTSNFHGISGKLSTSATNFFGEGNYDWGTRDSTGKFWNASNSVTYGATWTSNNDILGCALDLNDNKIYLSVNGTWNNSGDPTDGTGAKTITAASSVPAGAYFASFGDWNTGDTITVAFNFGGCPGFAISSGNADDNGYGNFEYDVPEGYLALCTKNLGSDGG